MITNKLTAHTHTPHTCVWFGALQVVRRVRCFLWHRMSTKAKYHWMMFSSLYIYHHTINRAAFVCLPVCLSVCSPTPPRSFDGSSPNLVGVCRWTSELPLRGSFLKRSTGQRINGSNVTFSEQTTPGWDHTAAKGLPSTASFAGRHTVSKSLIPSTGSNN